MLNFSQGSRFVADFAHSRDEAFSRLLLVDLSRSYACELCLVKMQSRA